MPAPSPPDPKRVAYDLWCIQEDRRMAGRPLQSTEMLVRELREHQPQWPEDAIHRGVAHFLAWMLADHAAHIAWRQRYLANVHRWAAPARPRTARRARGDPERPPPATGGAEPDTTAIPTRSGIF